MSGYGLANTKISVFRGVEENAFGDPEHRLDPDAALATNIPATFSSAKKTVLVAQDTWDSTSRTPRNIEPLIVRVGAAANRRVPGGGIQLGDLLLDQRRDQMFAVKAINTPYAVGRPSPDLVIDLDRLS